jgi:hypothetical protein
VIRALLSHEFKRITRSISFGKELTTTFLLGFLGLMMLVYTLILGFALDSLITKGFDQPDSFAFLNRFILYYFAFEFVTRYFIQNAPVLDAQPYLHLPVKRSTLIHYLLGKSMFHLLNILAVLLFAPFTFMAVWTRSGGSTALLWLGSLILLSWTVHYFVILFKKRLDDTVWGLLSILGMVTFFIAADYFQWFHLTQVSFLIFGKVERLPLLFILSIGLFILVYLFNSRAFLAGLYPDEWTKNENTHRSNRYDFTFLKSFGWIGEWINLEIKLILRHKRTRTILWMSSLLLLYGLIFYTKDDVMQKMPDIMLFAGVFVTGIFMINYGQFLFSWQAGHFDFTLTRPLSIRQYIESKYWLLVTVTFLCFLLSIPYVYFGWKILLVHFTVMLFNIGVNVYVIMNMAMWSPKKINLSKGGTLNYEGVGAAQWIMGIPILLGPYVVYLPFRWMGYPNIGLIMVGLAGVIGIVFRPYLLSLTAQRLASLKYKIASGFRQE